MSRLLYSVIVAAILVSPVGAISDSQEKAISENCSSIQQSLHSLQRSDSRTRVYLGSIYQTVLADYITPLNLRLVRDNRPNVSLSSSQTEFAAAKDESAQKFITYSQSLEELLLIDCSHRPEDFYNKLLEVRSKRSQLSESATKVRQILNSHVDTVVKLKETL